MINDSYPIESLFTLLEQERQALIEGKLDQLQDLGAQKEALVDQITAQIPPESDRARLQALQHQISRNQHLLTSALDSIRAVADRMADLRRVRQGLDTYDQRGRKAHHGTQRAQTLEKRA